MTIKSNDIEKAARKIQKEKGEFQTKDVVFYFYGEDATKEEAKRVSGIFTYWRREGKIHRMNGRFGWFFDDDENGSQTPPKKKGRPPKKPLQEITPISKPFTPNLSPNASSLATSLGAVLDDNQAYRDTMKDILNQLATFLGATIIYSESSDNDSKTQQ